MLVKQNIFFLLILISSVILTPHSFAKDAQSDNPLSPLFKCTSITVNAARLECMNREVELLQIAQSQKKIIVVDDVSTRALEKDTPQWATAKPKKVSKKFEAAIESIYWEDGKRIIKLNNDQLWQITSGDKRLPKGDLTITIRPAALSSFLATISNGRRKSKSLRVRLVE